MPAMTAEPGIGASGELVVGVASVHSFLLGEVYAVQSVQAATGPPITLVGPRSFGININGDCFAISRVLTGGELIKRRMP